MGAGKSFSGTDNVHLDEELGARVLLGLAIGMVLQLF